ncbi:hypothetical protein MRB53_041277 [Persea americana]|nr:hypothetical protein MRB53_041277 [Persea americana]
MAATDSPKHEGTESDQSNQQQGEAPAQVSASVEAGSEPAVGIQVNPSLPVPVLPDGFVSPVKERRKRPISQVKQAHANRRRTLPVNFSAARVQSTPDTETVQIEESSNKPHSQSAPEGLASSEQALQDGASPLEEHEQQIPSTVEPMIDATQDTEEESRKEDVSTGNEWEDVEEDDPSNPDVPSDMTPEPVERADWVDTVENTPTTPPTQGSARQDSLAAQVHERVADLVSPSKLPSSPVPSITGQHPRLPLRRSPRRQSTSPLKRSTIIPLEKSHLVAFTPVKLPVYQIEHSRAKTCQLSTADQSCASSKCGLTSNEHANPHQAFINRASESKNGRRTSATARRESLENRRNSDVVRQALASPAVKPVAADVLGDLDPNSPSPRKQAAAEPDTKPGQEEEQDELATSSPAKNSLSSQRATEKETRNAHGSDLLRPQQDIHSRQRRFCSA